jgi:hypothetical protein
MRPARICIWRDAANCMHRTHAIWAINSCAVHDEVIGDVDRVVLYGQ